MNDKADVANSWKYPVTSLASALVVAQAVANAGGANAEVQNPVIASALGGSHTSGAFAQRLSAARTYGLIVGGRGGYRLSDAGKRYFLPSSDSEKRQAWLSFISAPSVFAEIIKRFDGNVIPGSEMLANVLLRELKVPASWKDRVARFFLTAASDTEIIDSRGYLRYAAARQTIDTRTPTSATLPTDGSARPALLSEALRPTSSEMNKWIFSENEQTVCVTSSPGELSNSLWSKLNAYVHVLKPKEP